MIDPKDTTCDKFKRGSTWGDAKEYNPLAGGKHRKEDYYEIIFLSLMILYNLFISLTDKAIIEANNPNDIPHEESEDACMATTPVSSPIYSSMFKPFF